MGDCYMPHGVLPRCAHAVCLTQLTAVQYILCDSICAWRTVVLWNKDKRIIAILVFFNLATTGT